ncbi:MAG TPA: hypothetical protein VE338_17340 [Ktedonobacterales bacterium]|nr:hypothetical protein [Ktedonobacterales bacterium]
MPSAADASEPLPTLADPRDALRRAFGIGDDASAFVVIRPDGYLGLRAEGAARVEALRAYTAWALGSD